YHDGFIPYVGTFLTFSDYMRGSVRLAALSGLHIIDVWTHDSVGLGEDGPTHQPVEHYAALRAIPNLWFVRPGDANETAAAWALAIEPWSASITSGHRHRPGRSSQSSVSRSIGSSPSPATYSSASFAARSRRWSRGTSLHHGAAMTRRAIVAAETAAIRPWAGATRVSAGRHPRIPGTAEPDDARGLRRRSRRSRPQGRHAPAAGRGRAGPRPDRSRR